VLHLDHISPELANEFVDAVRLLQTHGRPELTPDQAVLEAIDDWITLARFEHLDGDDFSARPTNDRSTNGPVT
jgi:hypothetical protein